MNRTIRMYKEKIREKMRTKIKQKLGGKVWKNILYKNNQKSKEEIK